MNDDNSLHYTTFDGFRRIATGMPYFVALAAKHAFERGSSGPVLTFDDATGRIVDLDLRGSDEEVTARYLQASEPRGRGRPKLGVVPREVTLLPRHWDWLNSQPGGASVSLRKLVDQARRANIDKDQARQSKEVAYRFMSAMAGDLPDFEEATRAFFADDRQLFKSTISKWPSDLRIHIQQLAFGDIGAGDA